MRFIDRLISQYTSHGRVSGPVGATAEMPKPTVSIERRLYVLMACVLLPAVAIIIQQGFASRNRAIEEARARLGDVVKGIVEIHQEKTIQAKSVLRTLAALPEVRAMNTGECERLFAQVLADNPGAGNVALADKQGDLVASAVPTQEGINVTDRTWFREALRTGDFSVGDYIVGRVTKKPTVSFGMPVYNAQGLPTGVLVYAELLENYNTYFAQMDFSSCSSFALLDRKGVCLVTYPRQRGALEVGSPINVSNWRTILESHSDSGQFNGRCEEGVEVLVSFRKLSLSPGEAPLMVVYATASLPAIMAESDRAMAIAVALAVLAGCLALIMARLLSRRLVVERVQAILQSETRLRAVLENSLDAILLTDPAGRIVLSNHAAQAMFRMGEREMVAGGMDILLDKDDGRLQELSARREETGNVRGELRFRRKAGEVFEAEMASSVFFVGNESLTGTVIRDITERKRIEGALRESEERFRHLFEQAEVGIFLGETDGVFERVNQKFCDITGYSREELVGASFKKVTHPDDVGKDESILKALLVGRRSPVASEKRYHRKDGTDVWTRCTSSTIYNDSGQLEYVMGIVEDITEQKQNRQFREDVERVIRHDIKAPLSGLHSMASIALNNGLNDDLRGLAPGILHAIRQVIRLLDSSDKMAQMERGTYRPQADWFDLQEVAGCVQRSVEPIAQAGRVRLIWDGVFDAMGGKDGTRFYGEEVLFEDMLLNLVKNAVEASSRDGRVTISGRREEDGLRIVIHNQGAVPEDVRERFFEKYSTSGKSAGTGLGTYSAQLVANAHGGRIEFTTSDDDGTEVTVLLPWHRFNEEELARGTV